VSIKFQDLITDVSKDLGVPLKIDQNGCVCILFEDILKINIEPDREEKNLIIFTPICELPPGKYKENILLSALKDNNKFPYFGIFGYSTKSSLLTFHNRLPIEGMKSELLISYINTFVKISLALKTAIERGQTIISSFES